MQYKLVAFQSSITTKKLSDTKSKLLDTFLSSVQHLSTFISATGEMMRGKKITNNSPELLFLHTMNCMASFANRMNDREFVLLKMIEEVSNQPKEIQIRRLPEVSLAIAELYRLAPLEQKNRAFNYMKNSLWPLAMEIKSTEGLIRTSKLIAKATGILFENSKYNEKKVARTFIEKEIGNHVKSHFDQAEKKGKLKPAQRQKLEEQRIDALCGKLAALSVLFRSASTDEMALSRETLNEFLVTATDEVTHFCSIQPELHENIQKSIIMLISAHFNLFQHSSLEEKVVLINSLDQNLIHLSPNMTADYLEEVANLLATSKGNTAEIITLIQDNALTPAITITNEKSKSIALSRIIGCMTSLINREAPDDSNLKSAFREKITLLKNQISDTNQPAYIGNTKSKLELISKLNRATALLHSQNNSPEQRTKSLESIQQDLLETLDTINADSDAVSRQIAGAALAITEVYLHCSDDEKQIALNFILNNILPLAETIPPVIITDENGKETKVYMARVRTYSRVASYLANLYCESPDILLRQKIAATIEERLLIPLTRWSQLNNACLERLLPVYSAVNELVWGKGNITNFSWKDTVEKSVNYSSLLAHVKTLSTQDRMDFYISIGAFGSSKLIVRLLKDTELKNNDKIAIIQGQLFFHKIFPLATNFSILKKLSNEELAYFTDKIQHNNLSNQDIIRFIEHTAIQPRISSWGEIAELLFYIARNPTAHLHFIRHLLVILRLKSNTGETLVRGVNIEAIPGMIRPALIKIFSDAKVVAALYPELRALVRALPLDQFLINEIRIRVYKLFDDKLVPVKAGFLSAIRLVFHDSPTPDHLLIIRALVRYLETRQVSDREELNKLLNKYQSKFEESIRVPEDFIEQLGASFQPMLDGAKEVCDLYEDLYGEQQAKAIIRTLLDRQTVGQLPPEIAEKTKEYLAMISRLKKIETIEARMAKTFRTARDYPVYQLVNMTEKLAELRELIQKEIRNDQTNGQLRLYLLRLQNSIEPLVFSTLNNIRSHWQELNPSEKTRVVLASINIQMHDMAWDSPEYKELDIIRAELQSLPTNTNPLRYFAIMTRLERVLNFQADRMGQNYQPRVETYASSIGFVHREVREFSADLIRESVLFSFSLLLEQANDEFAATHQISRCNVTRPGKTTGNLVYIENPDDRQEFEKLTGDEIIILDHISPNLDFPRVRGIITHTGTTSLSHLAIHAGQHGTPWASPRKQDYEKYKQLAQQQNATKSGSPQVYEYKVTDQGITLDPIKSAPQSITKSDSQHTQKTVRQNMAPLISVKENILKPASYLLRNVGAKAYKLGLLSGLFPEHIPKHITVPFSLLDRLVELDPELNNLIQSLNTLNDSDQIQKTLDNIRTRILDAKMPTAMQDEIEKAIKQEFGNVKRLIVRSSSSIEDGDSSPGAGVYESHVNLDRSQICYDIQRVLASLYSWKAFQERQKEGFTEDQAKMAVVIQELKENQAPNLQYGLVIHNRNPHSDDPNEMLIEIAVGLGEALVSGEPVFTGDAHQFSYNRETGEIQRLRYANKSYQQLPGQLEIIDYSQDPLSQEEIPFKHKLAVLFKDAISVEKDHEAGNQKPQDIEGVLFAQPADMHHFYVQTRPQAGIEDLDERAIEAIRKKKAKVEPITIPATAPHKPSLSEQPPIFHQNMVPLSAYSLPHNLFNGKDDANLVNLWLQAFESVLGPGRVLMTPIGSLSYMVDENGVRWQDVKDFDLNFYITGITTEWEAWNIEKQYIEQVQEKFIELAEKTAGLKITRGANGRFSLMANINGEERGFEMKAVNLRLIPITRITAGRIEMREPDGYLPWYGYYGDPIAKCELDRQFTSERALTPDQISANALTQYRFAWERARSMEEGTDLRKLKEICRLAIIIGDIPLREAALKLLDQYSPTNEKSLAPMILDLWERLPIPDNPALQTKIIQETQKIKTRGDAIMSSINRSLESHRIAPGKDIFYAFHHYGNKPSMAQTMADALYSAYLKNGRFIMMDWSLNPHQQEVRAFLLERLQQATPSKNSVELGTEADWIMQHHTLNFDTHDDATREQWLSRYPQLQNQSDVSHIDFLTAWLSEGNRVTPEDTMMIQHVDAGSVTGLLELMVSGNAHSKEQLALIDNASQIREKVLGARDRVNSRADGELASAQRLAFAIDARLRSLKQDKALSDTQKEKEIMRIFMGNGDASTSLLQQMEKDSRLCLLPSTDRSATELNQMIKDDAKRFSAQVKIMRNGNPLGESSESGRFVAISRSNGIKDPEILYAVAGDSSQIVIDYEEIKSEGQVVGWRYHSLGRSPLFPNQNLEPLIANLNKEELEKHGNVMDSSKAARWRARGNGNIALSGPSGINLTKRDFSLIPPEQLLQLLELTFPTK